MSSRPDLVIRDALLHDGTGAPGRVADVAVRAERIETIGAGIPTGDVELDGAGLVLAPGFIDVHTHDDFAAVLHPEMGFKVLGGVTTCVVGNCGMGAAPFRPASLMARAFHPDGTLPEWEGYSGYLEHLDREPASVNVAALIGHGTVRAAAMGGAKRAPSATEQSEMMAMLDEGLGAGAVGLSTGLIYEPGRYAKTGEIVELASQLAGTGALYTTHMRNEGTGLLESVAEAIEIGERAGVPVQISHHKASGRDAWGLVARSLELIEAAQRRGLDVHADQYPYTAGSTVLAAIVQNAELDEGSGGALGSLEGEDVVIASAPGHAELEGRSLGELAGDFGTDAREAAHRVLEIAPLSTVILHAMSEDDVRTVMRHASTMIGSDGIPTLSGKPHPRLYGTFARVLGHYSRDLGLFPLEVAVHRMTGMSARKFGLLDRGEIREGAFADLALFDPERVIDVGTFEDPNHPPAGIAHVFVNGIQVVRDGQHTGARPGRPLRRS